MPVTTIQLMNSTNVVAMGTPMNFSLFIEPQKSSHIYALYSFGDGNMSLQYYEDALISNPSVEYTYRNEGHFLT